MSVGTKITPKTDLSATVSRDPCKKPGKRFSINLVKGKWEFGADIKKTYLYNLDPLKPHFYIVKLGFTGVDIIFVISAQKHRLWVHVRTASMRRF